MLLPYTEIHFPEIGRKHLEARRTDRGDEMRSGTGYMQYVQGIQPEVPACTTFIDLYIDRVTYFH